MKSKKVLIILIITIVLLRYICNNFIPEKFLMGKYANVNYMSSSGYVEIPDVADTLELFENHTFNSPFWGSGIYTISYTLGGTNINLSPDNPHVSGLSTTLTRSWLGDPKIILVDDLNHYYEKFN